MIFDPFDWWCLLVVRELQALAAVVAIDLWLAWRLFTIEVRYRWQVLKIRSAGRWRRAETRISYALLPFIHLPAALGICSRYSWLMGRCFLTRRSATVTIAKLERRANWQLIRHAECVVEEHYTRRQAQRRERSSNR